MNDRRLGVVEAVLDRVSPLRDAAVLDVRVGPYWTAVRTSAGTGMASTMAAHVDRGRTFPVARAGSLGDLDLREMLDLLRSESPPEAAVGLAAVNSLVDLEGITVEDVNAREILIERGAGRTVAVIGRFPFVDRIRAVAREVLLFERGPRRLPGELGPENVAEVLPRAEIVAISATTLINHTIDGILSSIDPEAFTILLGPSTPMMPCLFDVGIDLLCGSVVEDAGAVIRAVEQGAVTRQIPGVRRVAMTAKAVLS